MTREKQNCSCNFDNDGQAGFHQSLVTSHWSPVTGHQSRATSHNSSSFVSRAARSPMNVKAAAPER
jgi:hypothetical protein